jgi:outer membrane murein-binding lipoprotein Lpp
MNTNITPAKVSLIERIRQITSAAILVGGLLIGGTSQATVTRQSSVVNRAVAVQEALKEKMRSDANAAVKLPRAQVLLAQWGNNWGNAWTNWDNWHNWSNWGNFGNWINW